MGIRWIEEVNIEGAETRGIGHVDEDSLQPYGMSALVCHLARNSYFGNWLLE